MLPYHLPPKIQKLPYPHSQNPRFPLQNPETLEPHLNVFHSFLLNPHLSPLQTLSPPFPSPSKASPHRSLLRSLLSGEAEKNPKAKAAASALEGRRFVVIVVDICSGVGFGGGEEPPLHLHGRAHGESERPRLSRRLPSDLRHDCRRPHPRPPLLPRLDRVPHSQCRSRSRCMHCHHFYFLLIILVYGIHIIVLLMMIYCDCNLGHTL